jgi:hypothetical protein
MSKESSLWRLFHKHLRRHGDFQRIENLVGVGMPDVNGVLFSTKREVWIELKQIERWPARATTPLRIAHYTQEQRDWIAHRGKIAGNVYMLVGIASSPRVWLLYDWRASVDVVGRSTRDVMMERASVRVGGVEGSWLDVARALAGSPAGRGPDEGI